MSESRIIIADDHPLFLEGLKGALLAKSDNIHVLSVSSYLELFALLQNEIDDIDLILMDLNMPGASNEAGIFYIRKLYPEIPIVVLSAHDTIDVRVKCLESGASDFISKSMQAPELVSNIERMLNGEYQYPVQKPTNSGEDQSRDKITSLTPSQFKVLHLISSGYANKNIADLLDISEKTVKNHISAIFEKLGVNNRTQASNIFNNSSGTN